MAPQIATIPCILLVLALLWLEFRRKRDVSPSLVLPFVWMFLAATRYPTEWFSLGTSLAATEETLLDGSVLDRAFFFLLIALASLVLLWRQPKWVGLLSRNKMIWVYFLFGAVSILWSDYPLVSSKRLIKAFGNVLMALVILTDRRPDEALGRLIRLLLSIVLPVSVLFIKYYPDLGRTYHMGLPVYTGIAAGKNQLGQICLIGGIYICWCLFHSRTDTLPIRRKEGKLVLVGLGVTLVWLLRLSESATSLASLLTVAALLALMRVPIIVRKPQRLLPLACVIVVAATVLETTLHVSEIVISALGRDETLTTRVPMWQGLREMVRAPMIGVGFESFWLGDRLRSVWGEYGRFLQAHNGYLETYLNLGLIGLGLICGAIVSGFIKASRALKIEYQFTVLKLCFLVAVALYNLTEATFSGVNNMWLLFLVGAIESRDERVGVEAQARSHTVSPALRRRVDSSGDVGSLEWAFQIRRQGGR